MKKTKLWETGYAMVKSACEKGRQTRRPKCRDSLTGAILHDDMDTTKHLGEHLAESFVSFLLYECFK